MPVIRVEFDKKKVKKQEILDLSEAIQKIVSQETGIKDVFVYANSAEIMVKAAPLEIFVEMSASKIANLDSLLLNIKKRLVEWKNDTGFLHPINLTLNPMQWKFEIGI